MLAQRFINRADRPLARNEQRHDHERIDHDVAQRQQRQLAGDLQLLLDFRGFQNLCNFVVGFLGHVGSIPGSIRLTLLR